MRDRFRAELAPISDSYLRNLLRDSGAALHPLVEGVRQHDFEHLERTLAALGGIYLDATAAGDQATARLARRLVIEAKDHARLASRRHPGEFSAERILWMLTWLENPGIFATWVRIRKGHVELPPAAPAPVPA